MLSADARVVVADYEPRVIPQFPRLDIETFCDRWSTTLAAVATICEVDYRTVSRARDRYRTEGKVNPAIWLQLGITDQVWSQRTTPPQKNQ